MEQAPPSPEETILLTDMGGTATRCAVLLPDDRLTAIRSFENRDYAGPEALLGTYLRELDGAPRPGSALLAVAAPLSEERVRMINIGWSFEGEALAAALRLRQIEVLNDFAALAHALPALGPEDLHRIGPGEARAGLPRVVLGPGTGLGTAGLIEAAGREIAISGEGGHVTLPASDEEEARIIAFARRRHGHCSAERLISGPGLNLIHEALHGSPGPGAAAIGAAADAGDAAAAASLEQMFRLLGTVAADLALCFGALGGVYIGGGIIPRHIDRFARSGFRERFESKGRYVTYLRHIPTQVIVAGQPALRGLARYARARPAPRTGR